MIDTGNYDLDAFLSGNELAKEIDKADLKKAVESINMDDGISDNEMKTIRELIAFDTKKAYIDTQNDCICPGCGMNHVKRFYQK